MTTVFPLEPRPARWCKGQSHGTLIYLSLKKVLEFFKSADKVTVNGDDRSVRRCLLALKAASAFKNKACMCWAGGFARHHMQSSPEGDKVLRPDRTWPALHKTQRGKINEEDSHESGGCRVAARPVYRWPLPSRSRSA
jgi:hypothetical protein